MVDEIGEGFLIGLQHALYLVTNIQVFEALCTACMMSLNRQSLRNRCPDLVGENYDCQSEVQGDFWVVGQL